MKPIRTLLLLALLAAHTAQAAPFDDVAKGTDTSAIFSPTAAAQTLFVNGGTGSDGNACTSSTAPCLTIQGAIDKIPPFLASSNTVGTYNVTVTIAAGTYTENLRVSGFRMRNKGSSSLISFVGAKAIVAGTSTSYTGTAAGDPDGSVPSGMGNFTLAPTTPGWTVDLYKGRFIEGLTGTGVGLAKPIASNTTSVVEYVNFSTSNPFANASTWRISSPSVLVVGTMVLGDNGGSVVFTDMDFANGTSSAVDSTSDSLGSISFTNCRISVGTSTSTSLHGAYSISSSYVYGGGTVAFNATPGTAGATSSVLAANFTASRGAVAFGRSTLDTSYTLTLNQAMAFSIPSKVGTGSIAFVSSTLSQGTTSDLVKKGTLAGTSAVTATFGSVVRLRNVYVDGAGPALSADYGSGIAVEGTLAISNASTAMTADHSSRIFQTGAASTGGASWGVAAFSARNDSRTILVNPPSWSVATGTLDGGATTFDLQGLTTDVSNGAMLGPAVSGQPAYAYGELVSLGGVVLGMTSTRPTCAVSYRGLLWLTQGASLSKDVVAVCAKDAADIYAWRSIY